MSDEAYRKVLEAENALAQAIYLADHFAEENGGNPAGEEFTGSYTMSAGLWNAVLREKQNLRYAIQTTFLPDRTQIASDRTAMASDDGFTSGPNTPLWPGVVIVAVLIVAALVWWLA